MNYSWFTHPNSVCMTYIEHCLLSLGFSMKFALASAKAFIHAFAPNYFITSTSDTVHDMSKQLYSAGCRDKHQLV